MTKWKKNKYVNKCLFLNIKLHNNFYRKWRKNLVFLSKVIDDVVFYIEFEGSSINIDNNTFVDIYD